MTELRVIAFDPEGAEEGETALHIMKSAIKSDLSNTDTAVFRKVDGGMVAVSFVVELLYDVEEGGHLTGQAIIPTRGGGIEFAPTDGEELLKTIFEWVEENA